LVGQRATAVIMPIKMFFELKCATPSDCEITLIHTTHTINIAKSCQKWFQKVYSECQVNLKEFFKEESLLNGISYGKGQTYFNVNAGMNWQVAYLCMMLPEATKCLASDTEYYYMWNLMDDAKKAKSFELADIGLESYLELSGHLKVKSSDTCKDSLHQSIRDIDIVKNKSFNISFRGDDKIHTNRVLKSATDMD